MTQQICRISSSHKVCGGINCLVMVPQLEIYEICTNLMGIFQKKKYNENQVPINLIMFIPNL